jgi:hypothetical protein
MTQDRAELHDSDPAVRLEHFSAYEAKTDARRLRHLVRRNKDWLPDSNYEGALARYNRLPLVRAARQLGRVATSSGDLRPYIISLFTSENIDGHKYDEPRLQAIGIGTIITGLSISPPGDREQTGDNEFLSHPAINLDYWCDARVRDSMPDIDQAIARTIIQTAQDAVFHTNIAPGELFATLTPGAEHQPIGFKELMQAPFVAEPLKVSPDHYDVARSGIPLETYRLSS